MATGTCTWKWDVDNNAWVLKVCSCPEGYACPVPAGAHLLKESCEENLDPDLVPPVLPDSYTLDPGGCFKVNHTDFKVWAGAAGGTVPTTPTNTSEVTLRCKAPTTALLSCP